MEACGNYVTFIKINNYVTFIKINVQLTCTSTRQLTDVTSCMGQAPGSHSCVVPSTHL
jgi:hypothetical protein